MNERIEQLLNELMQMDPSLKGQEASMKKTIEQLLSAKPESDYDEKFAQELKEKILAEFSKQKKPKKSYPHLWSIAATLFVGALALTIWFNTGNKDAIVQSTPDEGKLNDAYLIDGANTNESTGERDVSKTLPPQEQKTEKPQSAPKQSEKKQEAEKNEGGKGQLQETVPVDQIVQNSVVDRRSSTEKSKVSKEVLDSLPRGRDVFKPLEIKPGIEQDQEAPAPLSNQTRLMAKQKEEADLAEPSTRQSDEFNTEGYDTIRENDFLPALSNPLSTFSIDVDTASYANMRRYLSRNQLPPKDAVRIEELINYFDYEYDLPKGKVPFSVYTEVAQSPWNRENKLVMIGLQGEDIADEDLPPSNLVFLLDVSGSMEDANKLPLLKESFKLLVRHLNKRDRVAMVVYAGAAGVVLDSTPGDRHDEIFAALNRLNAGGSTAGGAGINLAYKIARDNYIKNGNNRIILATDGDFNVGASSDADMERLIEGKREEGIFLTVLGFGMGNYKDSKMEILADKGNGNYAYIDSLIEAKKVLSNDLRKTLFTIAKDVKIQVEFNPAEVKSYRLIGYENRLLKKEDFRDDLKDAGEIGAGHSVTAFYEIVPQEKNESEDTVALKYQTTQVKKGARDELLTVHIRYKKPDGNKSKEITQTLIDNNRSISQASSMMRFASSVAEYGMLLRDSKYKANASYERVLDRIRESLGKDPHGYKQEFLRLIETAEILQKNR